MIPGPVAEVCATFLDVAPPGLVTGLYLRGGTGFGEWVPGQSDVDFVATLSRRPDVDDVAALRLAHAEVRARHPEPSFDGLHVLAADLAADPDLAPPVPTVLAGTFDPAGHGDRLVAWHELAWHGVTVLGPPIVTLGVWTDRSRLVTFTRDNLDGYWRGWTERLADVAAHDVDDWTTAWCVLGPTRLHHLLVTGEMTTKSRAGRWALGCYPEGLHRVLRDALRIRGGGGPEHADELGADGAARGHDVAALLAHVVAAGTGR